MNSNVIRFLISGGVSSIVYLAVLELLVRAGMAAALASAFSYVLSAIANYLLHYYYSFSARSGHGKTLAKFVLVLALGAIFSSLSLVVFADLLQLPPIVGGIWVVVSWPFISYYLLSRLIMR